MKKAPTRGAFWDGLKARPTRGAPESYFFFFAGAFFFGAAFLVALFID